MRSAKRNQYFWQLQPKLQLHINVILAAIKFSYAGANIANIRHLAILANIFAIFATPFRRIYQHRNIQNIRIINYTYIWNVAGSGGEDGVRPYVQMLYRKEP